MVKRGLTKIYSPLLTIITLKHWYETVSRIIVFIEITQLVIGRITMVKHLTEGLNPTTALELLLHWRLWMEQFPESYSLMTLDSWPLEVSQK